MSCLILVNGLIDAKGAAYPDSREVEERRVYKLRSRQYIGPRQHYYFARIDYDGPFFVSEMFLQRRKREYESPPDGPAEAAWDMIQPDEYNYYQSYASEDPTKAPESKKAFEENCVLYFPSNRF